MMAEISGLSAPSRVTDVVAVDTESERTTRDADVSAGADTGSGGRSLLRTAVGGRGRVEIMGRRWGMDLERTAAIGGAESGSASSSWRAGRSRMSIDDIESFIPEPERCPRLVGRRDVGEDTSSSKTPSSSVSLRALFRGGDDVLDESDGMSDSVI